jgi:hypothetical protein
MSRFAQGKFTPKNPEKYIGKKTPTYRSGWEFTFCKFCDENPNIQQWASEAIRIPYKNPFTGKNTVYVPDFFISYTDQQGKEHVELIEVKPKNQAVQEQVGKNKSNQAQYALNQVKWAAAQAWCKQQRIKFRIVTEDDIFGGGRRR